jgi:hypothetical protein
MTRGNKWASGGEGRRTCKDGAGLLGVEIVICFKHKWNRPELQVEDCPAERDPEGEEEDDGFGDEHVYDICELVFKRQSV